MSLKITPKIPLNFMLIKLEQFKIISLAFLTCSMLLSSLILKVQNFERFSNKEGFNQNTINAISQDRYGFLWFGTPGVAENGAIWVSQNQFPDRVLPFVSNDLDKKDMCSNLNEAYKLIAKRERNFGLFIAGTSKTADIEQCLVIGAQGTMSLTVLLV